MVSSRIFPNEFTFPFLLKACASRKAFGEGTSVHSWAVKIGYADSHVCVQNGLISFYVGCGRISSARFVFDVMESRTLVSWNSIIGGYAKIGSWEEAFILFHGMREDEVSPDGHTFVNLLSLCSRICDVELGKLVHCLVEINGGDSVDVYVQNALLDMYAKCRHLQVAEKVFTRMAEKNVVSWTSMVSAYAKHGLVELGENIFSHMPAKNVVSWNSMISCYLMNGCYKKCIELFYRMCASGMVPDETTIVSVLSACSQVGDIVTGTKLHGNLHGNGMQPSVSLCNSLIDMYAKCGSPEKAVDVLLNMPERNIVSWNTLINTLALHGYGYQAIEIFQEMEGQGILPDAATFGSVLSACCHCGLVDLGKYFFSKMRSVYRIPYDIKHYTCMVDILGRRGLLEEMVKLVVKMEMKPDVVIWGTLLGACRIHRNVPVGKLVLKQLLELGPSDAGPYVLLSNIFYEAQQWDKMRNMRKLMKSLCGRKAAAVSSIEINGCISDFMADDKNHKAWGSIYMMLNQMKHHLKSENDERNYVAGALLAATGVLS